MENRECEFLNAEDDPVGSRRLITCKEWEILYIEVVEWSICEEYVRIDDHLDDGKPAFWTSQLGLEVKAHLEDVKPREIIVYDVHLIAFSMDLEKYSRDGYQVIPNTLQHAPSANGVSAGAYCVLMTLVDP